MIWKLVLKNGPEFVIILEVNNVIENESDMKLRSLESSCKPAAIAINPRSVYY